MLPLGTWHRRVTLTAVFFASVVVLPYIVAHLHYRASLPTRGRLGLPVDGPLLCCGGLVYAIPLALILHAAEVKVRCCAAAYIVFLTALLFLEQALFFLASANR